MNIQSIIKLGFISQVLLISALSISSASAAKLYKWVDDQGRISYQDKPPPVNSKILSEKTLKDRGTDKSAAVKSTTTASFNTRPVDVYVTKGCSSCENTIKILADWGIPYAEKAIEEHRDIQTRLLELTEGVNVPALFFGNEFLSDTSTTAQLRETLERTGHLKPSAPVSEEAISEEFDASETIDLAR